MMSMMIVIQEYLEYQRQMALQRMHEQEMEMRRRLEQQKQEQQMRAMQYTYPQVGFATKCTCFAMQYCCLLYQLKTDL